MFSLVFSFLVILSTSELFNENSECLCCVFNLLKLIYFYIFFGIFDDNRITFIQMGCSKHATTWISSQIVYSILNNKNLIFI